MRRGLHRWGACAAGLLICATGLWADQQPPIQFLAPKLTLRAERTQAVPFAMGAAYTEDLQPEATSADPDIVEIVRAPEVYPGTTGFFRVRAHRPGQTTLRLGQATVPVEVQAATDDIPADRTPRIVGPARGGCVWGKFALAVEWLDDGLATDPPAVALRLADGRKLAPVAVSSREHGPVRRARFDLDAAQLPGGSLRCAPLVGQRAGEDVSFLVLHPGTERLRLGECEDTANARRPARFKNARPTVVINDAAASGKKAVSNSSPDPVWTLPLDVAIGGYYQLALVVRGTAAGGALPSLGIYLDEEAQPVATARLVHTAWHRLIVGRPIRLEPGARLLSVRFENDFFAGKGFDRNLWLDRYELVRVVGQQGAAPAAAAAPTGPKPENAMAAAEVATPAPVLTPTDPDDRAAGEFIAREEEALAELNSGLQIALVSPESPRRIETDEVIRVDGWLRGENAKDHTRSELWVNGVVAGSATGQRPKFSLPAYALGHGENRLELRSSTGPQRTARSASLTLWRAEKLRAVPTAVRLGYPAPGQVLTTAEGVSARAEGLPAFIATAELLVDGEPYGPRLIEPDAAHPLFFPLPIHSLAPGSHELAVRLTLVGAEKGAPPVTSDPLSVVVQPAPAGGSALTKFQRALRLLDRFAFGAEPRELARLLELGEDAWLEQRLTEPFDPGTSTSWQAALLLFPPARPNDGATVPRALTAMLLESNPVRLRFTLWAENHFSTWIQKAGASAKWAEHTTFARLGVAPFADLLLASATSPAMLQYLDQQKSVLGKVNENYARELLELHTVGVRAGYTQQDVTRLAAVLTGWMTADEAVASSVRSPALERAFRFDPALNDGAGQRIFGVSYDAAAPGGRFDRVRFALEVLAAHPATARFICGKLAAHYVRTEPPAALVEALAQIYLSTGGDLRAVLREIPRRPEFWQAPPRMTTPLDYALRLARVSGSQNAGPLNEFLRRSGTGLFDRPSPDGYPESDIAYADSQALSQRWRFAQSFALPAFERGDDTPVAPRDPAVRQAEYAAILQHAAVRLTGRPLSGPSLLAAQEMFAPKPGQRRAQLIRDAAQIIAQLPEVQLR